MGLSYIVHRLLNGTLNSKPNTVVDLALIWAENDDQGFTRLAIALGDPNAWLNTVEIPIKTASPSDVLERYHANYSAVTFR